MSLQTFKQNLVYVFEYNTPLVLHTNSKIIGITFRLLQFTIGIFIFVYYIGYKSGYQAVSYTIISSSTLDRKDNFIQLEEPSQVLSQAVDVKGIRHLFFPTSTLVLLQGQGTCPEDPRVQLAECNPSDNHCVANQHLYGGNGIMTGRCILHKKSNNYSCEINGWCPVFPEVFSLVHDAVRYDTLAVVVENSVYFPEFPERGHFTNYGKSSASCWAYGHYYSSAHPLCPLFKFKTIAEEAAKDPATPDFEYRDVLRTGGVLLIRILWDCNFDIQDPARQCSIGYQFRRMDPVTDVESRHPDYRNFIYNITGIRAVSSMYGIHIFVLVEGKARKFDLFTCLTRVGAGVGLFAGVAVFCEIMLTCVCCARERKIRRIKFVEMPN